MIEKLFKKLDRGIRVLVIASMLFGLAAQTVSPVQAAPAAESPVAQTGGVSQSADIVPAETTPEAALMEETPPVKAIVPAEPATVEKGLADILADFNARPVTDTVAMSAQVDPSAGGELASSDGRVRVAFPAKFVDGPVQAYIRHVTLPQAMAENAARQALALEQVFELTLEPVDKSLGALPEKFSQPVALTMDATGRIAYPLPRGQSLWVGYYDPDAGRWVRVPFAIDRGPVGDQLLLRVQTDHFSTWAYGNDLNAGWLPLYSEPQVALFSGAATYNVPIDVPPGRGGLQPQLALTYNSRQMEGILGWTQAGWVGLGWNLDMVSISRGIQYHGENPSGSYHECKDELLLLFGGAGYRLVPGERTATGFRYYTLEYSQLYVERRNRGMNDATAENVTGEYWIVRDPQGTEYRVGHEENAEIVKSDVSACNYDQPMSSLYGGAVNGFAAFWWHLDQVTDRHGNQMSITYTEVDKDVAYPGVNEEAAYLDTITYNGGLTWIKFNLGWSGGDGHGRSDSSMFYTDRYLDSIVIYQNGAPLQKYQLYFAVNPEAYNFGDTGTRLLTGVQQFDGSGTRALPKTGFEYMRLDNHESRGPCDAFNPNWRECFGFPYHRLSRVDNGYGGWTSFAYARDNAPWWRNYSYRVTSREVYDGLHAAPALSQYTYGPGCYDVPAGDFNAHPEYYPPDALLCQLFPPELPHSERALGYAWVTATAKDYDGAVLSTVKHSFTTNEGAAPANEYVSKMAGREYKTEWFDPNGALLRAQETEYAVVTTPGGWDVRAMGQVERIPDGAASRYTRTAYSYDVLGNQTAVYEYGAEEYLHNAGFESGLAFWTLSPTGATLNSTAAFAGQNSLSLVAGEAVQTVAGLVPGVTYAVRLQMLPGAPWEGVTLHVTDAQGLDVSAQFSMGQPVWLTFTARATSAILSIFGEATVDEVAIARVADVGDERSTLREFYPNPNVWIVNAPACESVYAGVDRIGADTRLKAQTFYDYDDVAYPTPPVVGNLTHVRKGNGAEWQHTYMRYDQYGNQTDVTDSAWRRTNTAYDDLYHVYPVQVTPPLASLATRSEYYGVNVPADGQPVGLLKQVIDPNNQATRYTFDPFGRTAQIFKPGDTAVPSVRYEYRDGPLSSTLSGLLSVANADFETPNSAWYTGNATPYAYATTQPHGGSRSLKITFGAGDQWVGNETIAGWSAGRTYWVSAWVKTDSAGVLCLHLADKVNFEVSAGCWPATGEWQRVQGGFYLPQTSPNFLLLLRGSGVVYVDDVQIGTGLENNAAPFAAWMPIPNYNFSFEYPDEADSTWQTGGANSTGWGRGEAYNGKNGAYLTSNGGDAWLGNWQIPGWQAGATYGVSVWAKAASGAQPVCLRLVDDNYTEIAGDGNTCRTVGAEWQLVSGFITPLPPVEGDSPNQGLLLRLMNPGTVLFDDVKVWRVSPYRMEIGSYTRASDAGDALWTRRVFDGQGRAIQTQTEKDGNQATVVHTQYNALGQAVQTLLPVEQTGAPTGYAYLFADWSQPKATMQYDGLGRATAATAPDGTATLTEYRGFTTKVTDANTHDRESEVDGLGRTVVVREPANAPLIHESETSPHHLVGSAQGNAWVSPPPEAYNGQYVLTFGPYLPPAEIGPGQTAHFRLAMDQAVGANVLVAQLDVLDSATFAVLAHRAVYANEFPGGLNNWRDFVLQFDTTGYAGRALQYRVFWFGHAQLAHDKTTVIWAQKATTVYAYDILDQLVRVTDALAHTTVITYNALGQKVAMADPDMGRWQYAYDLVGNLIGQTDAKGQTLIFDYDLADRLTAKRTAATTLATYAYDEGGAAAYAVGRRTSMADASGSSTWRYDARGRVIAAVKTLAGAGTYTTAYAYDPADRVTSITYPTGEVVAQTYNAAGQLSSVTGQAPYLTNAVYDAAGRPAQVSLGNGLSTVYSYYPWTAQGGCLQRLQTGALQQLQYTYDPVGNVQSITDLTTGFPTSGEALAYTYDALDRLTGVTGAYTEAYTYDLVGNMLSKNGQAYSYTDPAHVHAVTAAGSDTYTYDANGNMIRRVEDGVVYTQTFDVENRLIAVTSSVSGTTGFTYDGDGARVTVAKPNGAVVRYPFAGYEEEIVPVIPAPTDLVALYYPADDSAERPYAGWVSLSWNLDMITIHPRFNVYRRDVDSGQPDMSLIAKNVAFSTYEDKEGSLGDAYAVTMVTPDGESAFSNIAIAARPCRMCNSNKDAASTGSKGGYVAVIQRTTYGLGAQTTAVRVSGDPNPANNGLFYVHADHLGSASLTTDIYGNPVARQSYRPYGEVRTDKTVGKLPTNAGYTGQRLDETGLMYYNARYYSPRLGRFISADTIVPEMGNSQSLNRYTYANNSPITFNDPSGHLPIIPVVIVVAAAAIGVALVPVAIDYAITAFQDPTYFGMGSFTDPSAGGVCDYIRDRGAAIWAVGAVANILTGGLGDKVPGLVSLAGAAGGKVAAQLGFDVVGTTVLKSAAQAATLAIANVVQSGGASVMTGDNYTLENAAIDGTIGGVFGGTVQFVSNATSVPRQAVFAGGRIKDILPKSNAGMANTFDRALSLMGQIINPLMYPSVWSEPENPAPTQPSSAPTWNNELEME